MCGQGPPSIWVLTPVSGPSPQDPKVRRKQSETACDIHTPSKASYPIFLHPSFIPPFLYISKQGRDVSIVTAKAMPVCSWVSLPLRAEHTHGTQATGLHSLGPWDGHTLTKWDPPPHSSTNLKTTHPLHPRNTGVPSLPISKRQCPVLLATHQQHRTKLLSSETCKGPILPCELSLDVTLSPCRLLTVCGISNFSTSYSKRQSSSLEPLNLRSKSIW